MSNPAKRYPFRNEMKTCKEIADSLGCSVSTVKSRVARNLPLDAPRMPRGGETKKERVVTAMGQPMTYRQIAEATGLAIGTVKSRIHHGRPLTAELGFRSETTAQRVAGRRVDPHMPYEQDEECQRLVREHSSGMQLDAVGKVLGITRERVRQIETQALRKLRHGDGKWFLRLVLERAMYAREIKDARESGYKRRSA